MMLEPEKLQNRGKQGWPDAGKGTGHKGDKKVNTLVRYKWTPIEQPNALGGKQRLPKQGKNVCSIIGQPNALGGKQRLPKQGRNVSSITGQPNTLGGKQRLPKQGRNVSLSQAYICTSSCMHSGGAHGPSHVVLQETVYKQHLLQLAQARPTMPTFTSIV